MSRVKTSTEVGEGGDLLSLLDARMKRIAAETFRELAGASDVGAVKVSTAARLLDMNQYRVRQLVKEGRLKVINPTPNTIRIPLSEIRLFQEGQK